MSNIITKKVLEAYTRDVGRGVIRLDYATMDELNLSTGDAVQIESSTKKSIGKALPLYPSDEGKGFIRIDGLVRENLGTQIGNEIKISKINAKIALNISVYPLEAIPPIDERYITDALENVYVIKGDIVMIPYFGGRIKFKVIDTEPEGAVLITEHTKSTIIEEDSPEELKDLEEFIESRKKTLLNEIHKNLVESLKTKDYTTVRDLARNYNIELSQLNEMRKQVKKIFSEARKIKDVI